MKVLVFGGTGFVGHSLVPLLRQRQHDVMVLSRAQELHPRLAAPRLFGKRLGASRFRKLEAELTAIYSNAIELARRRGCPIIITAGTAFKTTADQVADESWLLARFGATRIVKTSTRWSRRSSKQERRRSFGCCPARSTARAACS